MTRSKRYIVWFVHLPGNAYAYNAWLDKPGTAEDARAWMRNWLGVKRLPNGTAAWPKDN